jgi:hypothetical protein
VNELLDVVTRVYEYQAGQSMTRRNDEVKEWSANRKLSRNGLRGDLVRAAFGNTTRLRTGLLDPRKRYFFPSCFAVGGTSPFRRRYIAAIP